MTGERVLPLEEDPGLRRRPLVYVDDLDAPVLDEADRHHLERVLRLGSDDLVTVGDGAGGWRACRLGPPLEPVGEVRRQAPRRPQVTVAFTPVKGARPEWVVQKLTEVGVDRIVPVITERSVVRWDGPRWRRRIEPKLATVATRACLQSRRLHRPWLSEPVTLAELLAEPVHGGAVLADPTGGPLTTGATTIVVGPEGGFTPAERRLAPTVELPGAVLRAETAALVAGAVLVGLRGGQLSAPG